MSKTKVHVLIPFSTVSACGIQSPYINTLYKEQVTCSKCKKTSYYKDLQTKAKGRRK